VRNQLKGHSGMVRGGFRVQAINKAFPNGLLLHFILQAGLGSINKNYQIWGILRKKSENFKPTIFVRKVGKVI
jgi:hypothetical protein